MNSIAARWPVTVAGRLPAALHSWVERERGRFAPWLAAGLVAGTAGYFGVREEPPVWAGVAAVLAAVAACALTWRGLARGAALMLLALALGFLAGQIGSWRVLPGVDLPGRAAIVTASVRGVDVLPDGRRLVLDQVRLDGNEVPLPRAVRMRMKRGDGTPIATGDRIQVRALLRGPAPPAYPGAWDLQREEYFNGLAGGGMALGPVQVLERGLPSGLAARVQGVRGSVGARAMAALPGSSGTIAATLLTGATAAIPASDRAAYRDSGLAHLLAVAGLHIGIIMGLVMGTVRLGLAAWPYAALHWPTKAVAAGAALLGGAAYLVLAGGHVPTVRAFAMASLVTLGVVAGRRALSLRGLALAAAAILLLWPQEVVGVSFQMSFAAVMALIAGYEAMRPWFARLHGPGWRRVAGHVVALVMTSVLAGGASAPYGAYHFGHVQLYFIAANAVAVPLTAFWVMPLGVAALLLMPFGLDWLAFVPMGWGIEAITAIARGVAGWPAATVAVPPMPAWGLWVFSAGLAWLCLWRTRPRLLGVPVMVAGLAACVVVTPPDVLVSPDARLIALRDGGEYRLQERPGAARFVRDAWVEHWTGQPMPRLTEGAPAGCDVTTCRTGALLLLRGTAHEADCAGVGLVVSAEPARGVCPGAGLVDRFTVWRDGAHAVWLGRDGPVVLSDRSERGLRPWVPGPPRPRNRVPDLPMAPAEPLPPEGDDP